MSTIRGTNRADILAALADGDKVFGLGGPDRLTSGFNRTRLYGGDGNDRLTTNVTVLDEPTEPLVLTALQYGGAGDDRLVSILDARIEGPVTLRNALTGGGGNDSIRAEATQTGYDGETRNTVWGAAGDDAITTSARNSYGGPTVNAIFGGLGDDTIDASAFSEDGDATNEIDGGAGADLITAIATARSNGGSAEAINDIDGGAGDDWISATTISGTNIGGATQTNTIHGGAGSDVIVALHDVDENSGSLATNALYGDAGSDIIIARIRFGDGFYSTGVNVVDGGGGNDALTAEAFVFGYETANASNTVRGGAGNDLIEAVAQAVGQAEPEDTLARNIVRGGDGRDIITGEVRSENGFSRLYGGAGNDELTAIGGGGNILDGGRGDDRLRGSDGADTFVIDLADQGSTERLFGFSSGFNPSVAADRLAFAGISDAGAPGLLDDLDAIATFSLFGTDATVALPGGMRIVFVGALGLPPDSFADLVEDPATQLVLADTLI